ncbi:MAG: flagellar motor stator protein MotA [Acidobacteria bacterium]|nr:flagellar motor stator protein MotA [Acidobacteriota bacterium]
MFVIIGFVIVLGAIIGGYLLEHGNLTVLLQPAELVIIGGAAFGTIFIGNPMHTVTAMFKSVLGALKGSKYSKAFYVEQLKLLNDIFVYARKNGMAKLEADLDEPAKSPVFQKYPQFLSDRHALDFFCDTVRMAISGGVGHMDLDQLMELDIEIQHHEGSEPCSALITVADALPGLGIVAAVLGVVITMGALGGPPEEIGHKVAAALVGTFLGILLCYGFLGPLANNISKQNEAHGQYMNMLRQAILAFIKGTAPSLAVEFARRAIPPHLRPGFKETEAAIKGGGAATAKAA